MYTRNWPPRLRGLILGAGSAWLALATASLAQELSPVAASESLIKPTGDTAIERAVLKGRNFDTIREVWRFSGDGHSGLLFHVVKTGNSVIGKNRGTRDLWQIVVDQLGKIGVDAEIAYESHRGLRYALVELTPIGDCIAAARVFNDSDLVGNVQANVDAGRDGAMTLLCHRGSGFPIAARDFLAGLRRNGQPVFPFPTSFGPAS